jgi:hypothetical protein
VSQGLAGVADIAVFAWKGHLPSDDEVGGDPATRYSRDFGEQWAYQACQPVAIAVMEAVRQLGHQTDAGAPYYGDNGWHFGGRVADKDYSIMVLWVPRGSRNDFFAVQPCLRRGCMAGLLLPRAPESALLPVREALQGALGAHPLVAELEWVSEFT